MDKDSSTVTSYEGGSRSREQLVSNNSNTPFFPKSRNNDSYEVYFFLLKKRLLQGDALVQQRDTDICNCVTEEKMDLNGETRNKVYLEGSWEPEDTISREI